MVCIKKLREFTKEQRERIQSLACACMEHEAKLDSENGVWFMFVDMYFCQRYRSKEVIASMSRKGEIDGVALLHEEKGRRLVLTHLFVHAESRGRGVATKILKAALARAKDLERKLVLNVNPRNKEALRLYEKLGFVPEPEQAVRMSQKR